MSNLTRREITLALLEAAGEDGVTTQQFLTKGAGGRFSSRIHELRNEGYIIEGRVTPTNGKRRRVNGFTYTLLGFDKTRAARNKEVAR